MRKGHEDYEVSSSKKRRLPRACDNCKRKKIRCDSDEMPGKRCSNCISFSVQCTHVEALNSMGSAKGYVQRLEQRLEKMEMLFKRRLPDLDLSDELEDETFPEPARPSIRSHFDDGVAVLSQNVNNLLLTPPEKRFLGKSCGLHLIPSIVAQKNQYLGQEGNPVLQAVSIKKREPFWTISADYTIRVEDIVPDYIYPEEDLMLSLVGLYFQFQNCYLPLLHRPTFERAFSEGLHWTDHRFGGTLLLVCALGARHSNDPRVFMNDRGAAGWKWYDQISLYRTALQNRELTTLYELQTHALSSMYLESIGLWESVWTEVGIALRISQDIGVHMHRANPANARDEHWKRAFWVLFFIDASLAALYGRPMALNYEDFDIDFPIECDDVYWDHQDPTKNFTQPAGQPSTISFFVSLLKLTNILTYIKRVIYQTRKPMVMLAGFRRPSDPELLANFDSILDQWARAIPTHLVWNPSKQTIGLFSMQSAFLHVTFQYCRILLHRPFIVGISDSAQLSQTSGLKTCLKAAHTCLDIVAELGHSNKYIESLHFVSFVNSVTLTLLYIMYAIGDLTPPNIERVYASLNMMKMVEDRLPSAGAFWDVLNALASRDDPDTISGPSSASTSDVQAALVGASPPRKRHRDLSINRAPSRQSFSNRGTDRRRNSDAQRLHSLSRTSTPPQPQISNPGSSNPLTTFFPTTTTGYDFTFTTPAPSSSFPTASDLRDDWRQLHLHQSRRMSEPFFNDQNQIDVFGGFAPLSESFGHISTESSWRYNPNTGIGSDSDPEQQQHIQRSVVHDSDSERQQDSAFFYHHE